MTTFSQMVDAMALELVRPDLRANGAIATYLNQSVRELHFRVGQERTPLYYDANRMEYEEVVDTEGTWLWTIPTPTRFQAVELIWHVGRNVAIPEKTPRYAVNREYMTDGDLYWYRSGPVIAIHGVDIPDDLKLSTFEFVRALKYKAAADRVVEFDLETEEYTLVAGGGVPSDSQLAAETHWMLTRWPDVLKEGIRAKVYKRIGDDTRMRACYSAFENMRLEMVNSEPARAALE